MIPKVIDVDEVIRSKSERLAKWLPRFVVNWLKRILHQDEMNEIIEIYRDDTPVAFASHVLNHFGVKVVTVGIDHLQESERFLVAANHPLGGLDGMALLSEVGTHFPEVVFPVNDLLLFIPQFKGAFIPINKHGSNRQNLQSLHETVAQKEQILYFPAGICSRKQKGGAICDATWRKSFINMAVRNKLDIVPTYIEGQNSNFFYNLSRWRRRFGIKANIEMIYLPDEMFKQKGATLKIIFGKPISYQLFDRSRKITEWAVLLQKFVYTLERGDESFADFLKQNNMSKQCCS